jgi:pyruvate,water dikinase
MTSPVSPLLPWNESALPADSNCEPNAVAAAVPSWGGKAQRLWELQEAGFDVPPFVVSPPDLEAAIALLGTPLVVRSSASVEDGRKHSFAGQFRSYLNLHTVDEVAEAIAGCRQSLAGSNVLEYCRHNRIDASAIRMEVIVQRMIEPELAGVAFTVDPTTGEEQVVVEACEGLADGLLAGQVDALPDEHPLLQRYRPLIERTARAIQRHFGAPQDIEFAVARGKLSIVQARPITQIQFAAETGVWTNADFRDGGVSSGVCSPLMWSLYELAWDHSLKGALRELRLGRGDFVAARMFFGRPYWNLDAVKNCLARLPGFVERDFDNDLSIQVRYQGEGRTTPITVARILRAVPSWWAIGRFFRRQARRNQQLLDGEFERLVAGYDPTGAAAEADFESLIRSDFLAIESNYFRTIFAASLAKMELLTCFPQAHDQSLLADLPPLRHMEPVRAVQGLPRRDERELSRIVHRFRHHYRQGLDICFPRWDEDAPFVRQMLRNVPAAWNHPAWNHPASNCYREALATVQAGLGGRKRRALRRKLDRLRRLVWLREEMRDLSSQMYYWIRRYVREIARRRGLGDDIFMMTFPEIVADDRSQIARHRETYESYRHFEAPNEIGSGYCRCESVGSGQWQGLAASAGSVQAAAFVARRVAEAAEMPVGSILVCPFTDPGWTPVLDRAAGVVTETGGLLSHAAVICREYGIPAILGVSGATRDIRSGQVLDLDGGRGIVRLSREAATCRK